MLCVINASTPMVTAQVHVTSVLLTVLSSARLGAKMQVSHLAT